jgi:RHS repeat-associated protein
VQSLTYLAGPASAPAQSKGTLILISALDPMSNFFQGPLTSDPLWLIGPYLDVSILSPGAASSQALGFTGPDWLNLAGIFDTPSIPSVSWVDFYLKPVFADQSKLPEAILSTESAVTDFVTVDYDAVERRVSVKDPRHDNASQTTYYTDSRQVFEQIDADGNTTAFEYYDQGETGAGKVKAITDALLQKSYRAYDLLGRQTRTWGETDYPQAYSYNSYGELATLTTYRDAADSIDFTTATWPSPSGGDTTTWTYDAATGLLTRKEYADGEGTDYSYDSANRLSVRTWARDGGLDTTYGYDANTGELLTVDYEDPGTADITYTYDRLGRQETVTDATGSRDFDYDAATLQLDTETLDTTFYDGLELTRSYDALGRASGYTLQDSASSAISAVDYTYANVGRLQTVSDGTDTFTYSYAADSNLLASVEGPVHAVSNAYEDDRNLMITVDNRATDLSGSTLSKYGYAYDALGRRDDRIQSGSAINTPSTDDFTYNSRSEVIASNNSAETAAAWNPTFAYDKIGNRQSSTGYFASSYTANELNQYTQVSGLSSQPSHDDDGNLVASGSWTYTWNNENRLSAATDGNVTINFTYDYQGRLVKKDDGTDSEVYVYDGWNRIATFTPQVSSLSLQVSYLWGLDLSGSMQGAGGVGGLLKETKNEAPGTTNRYALYDANGNIMQKLDGTGAAVMSVDYDPFGNIIDGTLVGEYGFSTKPLVDDLDWYYYGFRYYDPVTGRWPSRDPIGERGGLNLYGFSANSALDKIDVLGLIHFPGPQTPLDEVDCSPRCGNASYDPSAGQQCCGGQAIAYSGQDCCGTSVVGEGTGKCCQDGSVVDEVPRYENENRTLGECIGFYTNDPLTIAGAVAGIVGGIAGGAALAGASVPPAIPVAAGAVGLAAGMDAVGAALHCNESVCPE